MKAAYLDTRTIKFAGHGLLIKVSDLYDLVAKLPNGAIVERITYVARDKYGDKHPGEIEIAIAAGKLNTGADQ